MRHILSGVIAVSLAAGSAWGLEATAVRAGETDIGKPLQMRLDSAVAALTAALNDLQQQIANCSEQTKLFGPGKPGADANGCLPIPDPVPAGTIAGFHSVSCPSGWTTYTQGRGRMLIGYGSADGRSYTSIGGTSDTGGLIGRARVTLTLAQMPQHRHTYLDYYGGGVTDGDANGRNKTVQSVASGHSRYTSYQGSNQAHENRPPFAIVLWCQKI